MPYGIAFFFFIIIIGAILWVFAKPIFEKLGSHVLNIFNLEDKEETKEEETIE